MKDAQGHGSNGRGGSSDVDTIRTAGLKGIGIAQGVSFAPRYTNAARTVEAMRAQMRTTGPGHRAGLMQGIRNLLGG